MLIEPLDMALDEALAVGFLDDEPIVVWFPEAETAETAETVEPIALGFPNDEPIVLWFLEAEPIFTFSLGPERSLFTTCRDLR